LPASWRVEDHPFNQTMTYTRTRFVAGNTSAADVSKPSARQIVSFPAGGAAVDLHAHFEGGQISVPVSIAGRTFYFLLDSGASALTIDPGVAKELGLTLVNARREVASNRFEAHDTVISAIDVGGLQMHDVVASVVPLGMGRNLQILPGYWVSTFWLNSPCALTTNTNAYSRWIRVRTSRRAERTYRRSRFGLAPSPDGQRESRRCDQPTPDRRYGSRVPFSSSTISRGGMATYCVSRSTISYCRATPPHVRPWHRRRLPITPVSHALRWPRSLLDRRPRCGHGNFARRIPAGRRWSDWKRSAAILHGRSRLCSRTDFSSRKTDLNTFRV